MIYFVSLSNNVFKEAENKGLIFDSHLTSDSQVSKIMHAVLLCPA